MTSPPPPWYLNTKAGATLPSGVAWVSASVPQTRNIQKLSSVHCGEPLQTLTSKTANAEHGNPANNMRLTTIRRFVLHNPSRWPTSANAYAKLSETYTLATESSLSTSPDTLLYETSCEGYTNALFLFYKMLLMLTAARWQSE